MTGFDARQEAAMLRTLQDLHDGHLQLWVSMRFYDEMTGEPLEPPIAGETRPDRAPDIGTPNPTGEWWAPFATRGWIRLPSAAEANHNRWIVTEEGRRVLAAAHQREVPEQ